jgi:hypothetical protein
MNTFVLHLQSSAQYERIENVLSFVREDDSGSFGILAGHARMMTLLTFALARFRVEDQEWDYFAVLLSYLIQSRLAMKWKYISLYEARVPGRAQSPARYEENVRSALTLLGTGKVLRASKIGHLDLEVLLDSGTPFPFPAARSSTSMCCAFRAHSPARQSSLATMLWVKRFGSHCRLAGRGRHSPNLRYRLAGE